VTVIEEKEEKRDWARGGKMREKLGEMWVGRRREQGREEANEERKEGVRARR
jgi:hypothetical protein